MGSQVFENQQPLHVIVAGAGIGGFVASIGLRRHGHTVDIYEQSRLLQETGAAIHTAPNSYSQLKRLGLDGNDAVPFDLDTSNITPWMLIHRAQLHTGLKELALSDQGAGNPVHLHTGSRIASVGAETVTVHFENGTSTQGDVILGADGVHSLTRKAIAGDTLQPFDSGKSAFRMLVPRDVLLADPQTAGYNTMMNLAGIHPSELSPATNNEGSNWHFQAGKDNLLTFFDSFGPGAQLKLWRLLDMDKMDSFVKGRLAVLGDAAHPFLPYQTQGGAQAVEDAMYIAAVLPQGTTPAEITERLELYNRCRYERLHMVQLVTRLAGKGADHGREHGVDMIDAIRELFLHDEWTNSSLALMTHLRAKRIAQMAQTGK
ncbi:FAD/NAD(P)-binding domain-containing protein [Polychaeton citri CBS 116435]|uniref:FAD/NAD(P)-binding domain-containing protein n=1 Tax=Polychaeton citri CBS 116435 TaxID=1314669 RepID=A0A9P4USX0_9PEZI|nr:FAD/NAD(P)-binding domain-containing protein [Polychaeton citri CBS 116435]